MTSAWPHARRSKFWLPLMVIWAALSVARLAAAAESPAYPFAAKPVALLSRLDELRKLPAAESETSAAHPLPKDSLALLTRIDLGETLSEEALADAYLLASGVTDPAQRERYRKQLDEVTENASRAVAAAKTPSEQAEALLKFLHSGVMAKGYEADQTNLSDVFETGKFNCVSATVLYQIVGRRLGFDLQAVSIPGGFFVAGHAMTMLVEQNRRIDIETTNPDGFDFERRLKASGGSIVGPRADPKTGHDVSDLGLASLIAQNRTLAVMASKRPVDAMQTALIGLALDPVENAKANNFMAASNRWALALCEEGKFEPALAVLDFAYELLPEDRDLRTNRSFVWQKYAQAELKAGRERESIAVLKRAAKAMPNERFVHLQSELLIHDALDLSSAQKWNDGIALLERNLEAVDESPAREMRMWIIQIYDRHADHERKANRFDAAADVYAKAWIKWSKERDLRESIAFLAQDGVARRLEAAGPAAAAEFLSRLQREFPTVEALTKEGQLCAERAVFKLASGGKYQEAVVATDTLAPLAGGPEGRTRLTEIAFARWAEELTDKKDLAGALDVYASGLKRLPGNRHLTENAVAIWNGWARQAIDAKEWNQAIRLYEQALTQFPSDSLLKNNLAYCQEQQLRAKR